MVVLIRLGVVGLMAVIVAGASSSSAGPVSSSPIASGGADDEEAFAEHVIEYDEILAQEDIELAN